MTEKVAEIIDGINETNAALSELEQEQTYCDPMHAGTMHGSANQIYGEDVEFFPAD